MQPRPADNTCRDRARNHWHVQREGSNYCAWHLETSHHFLPQVCHRAATALQPGPLRRSCVWAITWTTGPMLALHWKEKKIYIPILKIGGRTRSLFFPPQYKKIYHRRPQTVRKAIYIYIYIVFRRALFHPGCTFSFLFHNTSLLKFFGKHHMIRGVQPGLAAVC